MKNRKSLIFALCAMMGAFAYTGCADDSGNSAPEQQKPEETINLTVNPEILTLVKGADGSFEVEYKANAEVSINTDDKNCVTVKNDKIALGDNKKGTVSVTAVGEGCNANITVASDGQSKKVAVNVVGADTLFLQLDKTNISLSAPGGDSDSAVVKATYSKGGKGINHAALTIKNSDAGCIGVPPSMETNESGIASIDVKALKADCSAEVTVSADGAEARKFNVTVAKSGETPEPSIEIKGDPTLTFDPESLEIAYEDKNNVPQIKVSYNDVSGNNKTPITKAKIELSSDNTNCIDITTVSPLTNEEGVANVEYLVKGGGCNAKITATTAKANATMEITVASPKFYDAKIAASLKSSRYDAIDYVAYILSQASCGDFNITDDMTDEKKNEVYEFRKTAWGASGENIESFGFYKKTGSTEDITTSDKPILATFDLKGEDHISVEYKSVFVYAKKGSANDAPALAYGCKDISIENADQTITVDLDAVPTNITGNYKLVSNFDLTSPFEKTPCDKSNSYKGLGICVPAVENMKPGDWVKFVTDFCSEPLVTLLEFAWSNTLQRLIDMKDDQGNSKLPDWAKSLLGSGTKMAAFSALEPMLDGLLGKSGEWYKILKEVAPDITDLTTNMQFAGDFDIPKDKVEGTDIKYATVTYKELQYQWSYKASEAKNCIADAYGKSKCRKSLKWSDDNLYDKIKDSLKDGMSGEWNGKITLSEEGEDMLEINSHALKFKWASMLYVAVFYSILPEAFDYDAKKKPLLKAFLGKILFEPIANAYNEKHPDDKVTITKGKECEAFIDAVVRMIVDLGSTGTGVVQTLASMACADSVIGKLDTLLVDALDGFQASTANGLNFSAEQCRLYDEGTLNYTKMGLPDDPVKTAGDIFVTGSKETTDRCTWNADFKIGENNVNLKGLFHATRQK